VRLERGKPFLTRWTISQVHMLKIKLAMPRQYSKDCHSHREHSQAHFWNGLRLCRKDSVSLASQAYCPWARDLLLCGFFRTFAQLLGLSLLMTVTTLGISAANHCVQKSFHRPILMRRDSNLDHFVRLQTRIALHPKSRNVTWKWRLNSTFELRLLLLLFCQACSWGKDYTPYCKRNIASLSLQYYWSFWELYI